MKDAVATMGNLLPDDAGGRDAVHVAVFSARSPVKVFPGQHVGLVDADPVEHGDTVVSPLSPSIGIVDPFLETEATPDSRFWVYLYPRTITALSHRWGHPAFEGAAIERAARAVPVGDPTHLYVTPAMKLASERWLKNECESNYSMPPYEYLLEAVENMGEGADYLTISGRDASGEIPAAMWAHLENVMGRRFVAAKPTYFSCSC